MLTLIAIVVGLALGALATAAWLRWVSSSRLAGAEAKRIMESALRLGLDQLRRIGSGESLEGATLTADLGWPTLLRTLRTLRGWSREELAAALGLTSSSISKQESGERRPTRAIREKVEQVLRVEGRMVEIEDTI